MFEQIRSYKHVDMVRKKKSKTVRNVLHIIKFIRTFYNPNICCSVSISYGLYDIITRLVV